LFGGKVKYGETIEQAAERELYEETGYVGQATLVGVKHYLVYSATTEQLLEDKYMRVCSVNNPH
jgi:8-oxo-dGTP pyrophosphatase MutT (NUDIX family)